MSQKNKSRRRRNSPTTNVKGKIQLKQASPEYIRYCMELFLKNASHCSHIEPEEQMDSNDSEKKKKHHQFNWFIRGLLVLATSSQVAGKFKSAAVIILPRLEQKQPGFTVKMTSAVDISTPDMCEYGTWL